MASELNEAVEWAEVKIPMPWGFIAGKWWGPQNVQPIIAIHGWLDNAGSFDPLAKFLKNKGFSILALDMPGHGFSSHLPPGVFYYVFQDGLYHLQRVVSYYEWKEPLTILGHSLGASTGFTYAATYPEKVKKLIGIDFVAPRINLPHAMMIPYREAIDAYIKLEQSPPEPSYKYKDMLKIIVNAHSGVVTEKGCEYLVKRVVKPAEDKPGYYNFTRDPRIRASKITFFDQDQVLAMARNIKCEVLNIRSKSGMLSKPLELYDMVLDEIEKNAQKMERHILPGTHYIHLNDVDLVSDLIYNFLDSK